jgi:hypothetical protein
MRVWTRFGGGGTASAILAVAAMVALPTGVPLSEVLAQWAPAAQAHEAIMPVVVTAVVWLALSVWLLAGACQHVVR